MLKRIEKVIKDAIEKNLDFELNYSPNKYNSLYVYEEDESITEYEWENDSYSTIKCRNYILNEEGEVDLETVYTWNWSAILETTQKRTKKHRRRKQ